MAEPGEEEPGKDEGVILKPVGDNKPEEAPPVEGAEKAAANKFDGLDDSSFNPDDLINELGNDEKENYGFDSLGLGDDDKEQQAEQPKGDEKPKDNISSRERKAQATLLTETFNTLQSFLNSIGTGNDFTKYKFSSAVTDDLSGHLDRYMEEAGTVRMPPWIGLILALTIAVLPQFIQGKQDRKAKKMQDAAKASQARNARREADITPAVVGTPANQDVSDAEILVDERGYNLTRQCEQCGKPLKSRQKRFCGIEHLNQYQKANKSN